MRCASTPRRSSSAGVDTVILGCTHYPLIRPVFERVLRARRDARLLRGRDGARGGRDARPQGDRERPSSERGCRFLTTGSAEEFGVLGERFLQLPVGEVERVALRDLELAAA